MNVQELAYTCYLTFARQPTFLAPEITYFNIAKGSTKDFYVKVILAKLKNTYIEHLTFNFYAFLQKKLSKLCDLLKKK